MDRDCDSKVYIKIDEVLKMKRKIVTVLLSICCSAMLFTGCGSSKVTLAQSDYKGIEVADVTAEEVTDEDVEDTIQSTLEDNATTTEITDRAVKDGDIVNIDYTGTLDGEEFEGGSAEGYDLEIGSGSFIPGFEDQLIGHETGEEFDINVTFPDEYSPDPDMAGKDTVFAIKINAITKEDVPKLDDDFVKSVSESSTTVEEYKKEVREQLEADSQQDAEDTFADNVMQAVLDKAEVSEYDEEKLEELKQDSKDWYEQIITMYYGMEMSDYLEQSGETEEEFDKEIEDECKETLKMQMVCEYIAEQEKLELSDDEFDEKIQEMVEENGYEDADSLIEDYASYYAADDSDTEDTDSEEETSGEDASEEEDASDEAEAGTTEVSEEAIQKAKDELRQNFLMEKVSNWLVENAKRVEATEDDAEETEDEEASDGEEVSEDTEESGESEE